MSYMQRDIKRRFTQALAPTLAIALMGYFIYHAIQGDRGLLAWIQLTQQLDIAKAELAAIKEARQQLEDKVGGLRPESLNRDLLEEQVRQFLGYSHPDELRLGAKPLQQLKATHFGHFPITQNQVKPGA